MRGHMRVYVDMGSAVTGVTYARTRMSTLNQSQLFEIAECGQKGALIDWLRENDITITN